MADWRITAIICNTGFQVEGRVVWTNVRFTWIRPEVDLEYYINPFISATCLYQYPLQVQTFCDIPSSLSWSSRPSRPSSTLSLVFCSSPSLPPLLRCLYAPNRVSYQGHRMDSRRTARCHLVIVMASQYLTPFFLSSPRNVSNPPNEITNKIGEIHLRKNGSTSQKSADFFFLLFYS